ncbi:tRNA threonylcarbamoyl adenosine modification protein, Sua5/YciO/YrdC/YwlC family [Actinomyces ruminicola]|uniref:L-threonylcarbamoyladenylate synthase n=1 Tax=Actinomyces ruminicola TaxID=332524 RepID=A0A1G9ZVS7_9ACTO|nr:L-threonylcarbamoyladenylate synthase [Actinomyces ruminicola]SDN25732.1 tRNA threonylcarbamoyl adenosine modification protein, Sua5/YciO/YrdC/YwlC family [Actinomyces ruminicola]
MTEQAHPEPAPEQIARAAAHVAAGGLLALPTDTVYGLGVRADDAAAVARLLAAKGRGRSMPPPVLVADVAQLDGVVAHVPDAARALMESFWPGALTLVLDAAVGLGWDLGDTGGTIAVRMPDHPLALALLRATGPMAVTSANVTGSAPATDAVGVRAAFPGRVVDVDGDADAAGAGDILLLDGGPTPGPVPSTIVSLAGRATRAPEILREGVITRTQLEGMGA